MHTLRSFLVTAAALMATIGAIGVPASAAVSAQATSVSTHEAHPAATKKGVTSITLSPAGTGVLRPDQDLGLTVTVTNDTNTDLPAGVADLDIIRNGVNTRDLISSWASDTSTDGYLGVVMDEIDVPAVRAHKSVTVGSIKVAAESVGLTAATNPFGARRIAASYSAGSTTAVGRSLITWYPSMSQTPTGVSVAMPITLPATDSRMIPASTLAAATAVDGTLTRQLDAAQDHNIALGIDPRIIASIRALGESAPSSAVAWLQRLTSMRNESFELSWADSDVTGLRQAGSSTILEPISLDQEVDQDNFPNATTPSATASASASASATSSPTPTATASGRSNDQKDQKNGKPAESLPTTKTLLDFPYSISSLAWPEDDSVSSSDIDTLGRSGWKRTIVSSTNTSIGADTTVSAAQRAGSDDVAVSDSSLSDLLDSAASAGSDQEWSSAMSTLTATLATATRQGAPSGAILLTIGRSLINDSGRLSKALDAIESMPWVTPTDLSTSLSATEGTLTVTDRSESSARLTQLRQLVQAEKRAQNFSTAITEPTELTAPTRLRTLALASNEWRETPGFSRAIQRQTTRVSKTTSSVGIVDSSNITLLGDRSSLPVSVRNKSRYAVKVRLTVTPSNSFLHLEHNTVSVAIQSDSTTRITVPVQSVANGKVTLSLALTSASGTRIADPSTVEINVQAQWETIITAAAAVAVILIFGIGILRNIRRRIRRKNGDIDAADADDDPNRTLEDAQMEAETRANEGSPSAGIPTALATVGTPENPADGGDRIRDALAHEGAALTTRTAQADQHNDPVSVRPPSSDEDEQKNLGRASAILAAGTMVSRVLGFAKTFVLAYAIGNSDSGAANAFAVSNQLPNNIYALIAGGLLSAVLIPQIVRAMRQHDDHGQAFVNRIVTLGGTIFIIVAAIATMLAPFLVHIYSQSSGSGGKGFDAATTDLAIAFAFWCLPQILFYALYSLLGEVLNARQVFGPFTWAPLINNVIAVAGLIVFIALFGGRAENADPSNWTPLKIAVLAGSATLGVVAQAAFLPFFWKRSGLTFKPDFRWRGVGLRSTGTAAGWLFAMILTTQLAGVVQSRVASLGVGAGNSVLSNAWLLFMLPHSIITVSIATAYFTRMSHDADKGDLDAVRRNLSTSLKTVGLFTVFATVAFIVVAFPFARIYENTFSGVVSVAQVLFAYMPGLVLFSMLFILQRVFWAMHDHRTPFLMQLIQSGLFVIGALAVAVMPGHLIGVGIATCTTLAGTAQTIVAIVLVRRRLGGMDGRTVATSHVQFLIASLIAGAAGVVVTAFFGAFTPAGFAMHDVTGAVITIVIAVAVMVVVYGIALLAARNPEVRSAAALVRRRLGR